MKNFILKLLIFSAIYACFDFAFGMSLSYLQTHGKKGDIGNDNYVMRECKDDLMIFGSSRAAHHYISNEISDSLKLAVYNAGRDGNGIIFSYGLLSEMLKHHKPKYIIYDLFPNFDWIEGDNTRYLTHFKVCYDEPEIKELFSDVDSSEKYKMISHTYRINSLIPVIMQANLHASKDNLGGYKPIYKEMTSFVQDSESMTSNQNIDPVKDKYLRKFIKLCKDNDIELLFVISPARQKHSDYFNYAKKLAEDEDVKLIDNSYLSEEFDNPFLYQDNLHLNDNGAHIYTKHLIQQIRQSM